MSKKRKSPNVVGTAVKAAPGESTAWSAVVSRSMFSGPAIREGIEALVSACILAFFFRAFAIEAFVIPTGSMAPTLMGQHKDLLCPQCGYRYQAGASSESEDVAQQQGHRRPVQEIVAVTCPLCRYTASVDPHTEQGRERPTYGGDRILVSKCTYEFFEPRRWAVTVFKNPCEAQVNYIKRLVGLPHETVRIYHGDLSFQPEGHDEFHFQHRDPATIRAMAQIVYDNDYVVDAMSERGWPVRWQPLAAKSDTEAHGGWTSHDGNRSYEIDGAGAEAGWLAYRHFVPSIKDWELLRKGPLPDGYRPRPRLITDFCAYNTSVPRGEVVPGPQLVGLHWVGDLLLECTLEITKAEGTATIELIQGGKHFRCDFDCATGQAQLSIDGLDEYQPTAQTSVRGKGSHRVALANFDRQLVLWVDGAPINFDRATTYEGLDNAQPRSDASDPGDLAPARVGSQRAGLRVSHLRLLRDIYYIAVNGGNWVADYAPPRATLLRMSYDELVNFWSTPAQWSAPSADGMNPFQQRQAAEFPLAADQFFVLGDNSPLSQDARLWPGERYVSRELLIGNALFIFWPHSFDKFPGTNLPFPFFPNFARMGFIR
ncbi:MAG TPA: S26 family signal peptidase [Pirellulales bacterium]|nr:S26 family signal peptidase [Pirellulales bacterium]